MPCQRIAFDTVDTRVIRSLLGERHLGIVDVDVMNFRPPRPARCLGFELRVVRFQVFRRVGFEALLNRKRPTAGAERAPIATNVAVAADVRDPARIMKASKVPFKGTTHVAKLCKNQPQRISWSFVISAPIRGNNCVTRRASILKKLPPPMAQPGPGPSAGPSAKGLFTSATASHRDGGRCCSRRLASSTPPRHRAAPCRG